MKRLTSLFVVLLNSIAFASADPFSATTHTCIKKEMIEQFPIYSNVHIDQILAWAMDEKNIDYMVLLRNPTTGRIESRSFILIRGDFANAALFLTESSQPVKIDLSRCF